MKLGVAELKRALSASRRVTPSRLPAHLRGAREAAVLVPLVAPPGAALVDPSLIFIVRPQTLTHHAGQVAFPGGVIDADDADAVAAALRETEEELGIARAVPEVLGQLDRFPTHTGYVVTPVIARVSPEVALTPSPTEVASHFTVSLAELAEPRARRRMFASFPGSVGEFPLDFWVDTPAPIWGVTGHILRAFLDVAGVLGPEPPSVGWPRGEAP